MPEEYPASQQYFSDPNTRLRDIEEKQRLLKDRTLLIGQNLVEERESTFREMQEMKKEILKLKEENIKMKEFIQRMSEQISEFARKEELMILQRQFDMFKPNLKLIKR
ncbi:MAG: hypothetical protein IIA87_00405 [Nanoarchaeota archaeon]|nr:hypothetical protein [Nanoarchaeota archaeon]